MNIGMLRNLNEHYLSSEKSCRLNKLGTYYSQRVALQPKLASTVRALNLENFSYKSFS